MIRFFRSILCRIAGEHDASDSVVDSLFNNHHGYLDTSCIYCGKSIRITPEFFSEEQEYYVEENVSA